MIIYIAFSKGALCILLSGVLEWRGVLEAYFGVDR